MKKVEVKCEDCGKVILVDGRSKCVEHSRCIMCINHHLAKIEFERAIKSF